jgi:hypothetical protein
MAFYHDTPENVAYVQELFGFEEAAARQWLRCEGQAVNNPTNPLNIRFYDRPPQTGNLGGFATYDSPRDGLWDAKDIVWRLRGVYPGYQRILDQANNGDAYAQARAIELSPWAAGHYGADEDGTEGCLSSRIEPENLLKYAVVEGYKLETTKRIELVPGTQIYSLDGKPLWVWDRIAIAVMCGETDDGKYLVQFRTTIVHPDRVARLTILAVNKGSLRILDHDYVAVIEHPLLKTIDTLDKEVDTLTTAKSTLEGEVQKLQTSNAETNTLLDKARLLGRDIYEL